MWLGQLECEYRQRVLEWHVRIDAESRFQLEVKGCIQEMWLGCLPGA